MSADLAARSTVPQHVKDMIKAFPKHMHPMTQFAAAINGLQTESEFAKVALFLPLAWPRARSATPPPGVVPAANVC